jgi:hypothetical protein
MSDALNIRQERIERILHELRYEIERGIMENEINEEMGFRFSVPLSRKIPNGIVFCEFRTRPCHHYDVAIDDYNPRLRIVK